MNGRGLSNALRSNVLAGIAQLVKRLFLDRRDRDAPAGAIVFGDDESSVRTCFDDRVADVSHIRNRLPIDQTVAPCALSATFDGVTGDRSRCELVPIVGRPLELVNHRT